MSLPVSAIGQRLRDLAYRTIAEYGPDNNWVLSRDDIHDQLLKLAQEVDVALEGK